MPRRPGITFETVTPSTPETLPRMDVAAFVGFATRGPIDVPVPVEDLARFRDVFGPPLTLVRDQETGQAKTAHLHRAVEAFFRNGGRRCWVVRVAQPKNAGASSGPVERASFGLPGLVSAETGQPSTVRARCYGATFDEMRVGTVLRRHLLPDSSVAEWSGENTSSQALTLSWQTGRRDPLVEDELAEGDLLRLKFNEQIQVSVESQASLSGSGTLLNLEAALVEAGSISLSFDDFRLVDADGNEVPTTLADGEQGVEVTLPKVAGDAGESIQLPIEIGDLSGKEVTSYKFTLPFDPSVLDITGMSKEGALTPDSAAVNSLSIDDRTVAFATIASAIRLEPNGDAGPSGNSRADGSSLRVQTDSAYLFESAPTPLTDPIASGVTETEDGAEVDVTAEVQTPSGPAGRPLDATLRRTTDAADRPVYHLVVVLDEETEEEKGASDLENRIVRIRGLSGDLVGWLQLGLTARRQRVGAVEFEVRDALWPVSPEDVFSGAASPVVDAVAIDTVERLRFDLLVWEDRELRTRLDRLGFAEAHSRAWTALPVDEDLFAVEEGEAVTPAPDTLRADVFEPCFPLASPESPGEELFLPLGMADRPDSNRTRGRIPRTSERSRLEKERLSSFSTDVFVDGTFDEGGSVDDLANTSTANLGEKADDMIYVDQKSASGMHSLWPIREATLLAVPDAVHHGWDEPQTVTPDSVPAPSPLEMTVDTDIEPPRIHLSWTVDRLDEEEIEVEVQEAQEPTFENPVVRYRGAESSVDRYVRRDDPVTLFFRYRVVADGRPEPWSNTRQATLPELDFDSCADRPEVPDVPPHDQDEPNGDQWLRWSPQKIFPSASTGDIDLNRADSEELMTLPSVGESRARRIIEYRNARDEPITDPFQLTEVRGLTEQRICAWEGQVDPPLPSHPHYEIQIDTSPTFETPNVVVGRAAEECAEDEDKMHFPVSSTPPGTDSAPDQPDYLWYDLGSDSSVPAVRYVRMRAFRPNASQMNSSGWSRTIRIVRDIKQGRPCISKEEYEKSQSDPPGGGREGLLNVQRAMLRFGAARGDVLSVLALPETDQPEDARRHATRLRTPGAVLDYGEERTLSYGALYYPWLLGPVDNGSRIASMPPDGAACGMIADRTLRDGAWMAPANIALADVPTVVPPLTSDDQADLETSPINVFIETPDGVLTLGTATLARDSDLEPITTRRLLILVRRLVQREGPALVFENNTPLLRRRIAEQFDDVLRRLFDRGAFAGATPSEGYRIVADESVNPPRQVERGRLVVELRIAPARPLKFLTVRLAQRSGQRPTVSEPGAAAAA